MLTIVLAYKTASPRKEVPKVCYFGHDRRAAKAVTVPDGYAFIETQIVPRGYGRKFAPKVSAKSDSKESPSDSAVTTTPADSPPGPDPVAGDESPSSAAGDQPELPSSEGATEPKATPKKPASKQGKRK